MCEKQLTQLHNNIIKNEYCTSYSVRVLVADPLQAVSQAVPIKIFYR